MDMPAAGELHLWFCDRDKTLTSDEFIRQVLATYIGVAPQQLRFNRGNYGKPTLTSPGLPIAFNFSDSQDWAVLAVSGGSAVGVDLEYCDPKRDVVKLARRCFSSAELDQLLACSAGDQVDCFYDYWTLKEANIKAVGGSLARSLESTGFELSRPAPAARTVGVGRITALAPVVATPAWYCLLKPYEQYRLALCCLAPQDFTPGLRLFEWPCKKPRSQGVSLLALSTMPETSIQGALR